MQLKGSKTEQHLKPPSPASPRPTPLACTLAAKADVEGLTTWRPFPPTAEGGRPTAMATRNIWRWRSATGLVHRPHCRQSVAAVAGETHEYTDMYLGMG